MKNNISLYGFKKLIPVLGVFFLLLGSGCQKTPINGDLDGEWEVMEVWHDDIQIERETRLFYNFSRHVCQLTVYGGPFTLGNLAYDRNEIHLYFPYIETPEEELLLRQYGIFSNPVSFNVNFESKSDLILSGDRTTIVLRKF